MPLNLEIELQRLRNLNRAVGSSKGLTVVVSLSPKVPPMVKGDPNKLAQVLQNLLHVRTCVYACAMTSSLAECSQVHAERWRSNVAG